MISFEDVLFTDPLVRAADKNGCSLEQIICLLVERHRKLMKEIERNMSRSLLPLYWEPDFDPDYVEELMTTRKSKLGIEQ